MSSLSFVQWINNLSGSMNHFTNPLLLPENSFEMLLNCSLDQLGSISHRSGTTIYHDLIGGTGTIQGIDMYQKDDGTRYLHMIAGGNLYVGNEGTDTWTLQASNVASSTSKVSFANYLNRHYFIASENGVLKHCTEIGGATTVSGNIAGKYLATNGAYLLVAGNDRQAYWSELNSDTFNTTVKVLFSSTFQTGVASFGNDMPFIVFTETSYIKLNPITGNTEEVSGFGCSSHYSIQNVDGYLIWSSRIGQCWYMLTPYTSKPQNISVQLSNNATLDAIANRITPSQWSEFSAGSLEGKYYCSIGDLFPAVSTPLGGGTAANYTIDGTFENWSNVNNALVNNTQYASVSNATATDKNLNGLKLTNFGFSIPSTATITGVEVMVRAKATRSYGSSSVINVGLTKGSTTVRADYDLTIKPDTSVTDYTLGNPDYQWYDAPLTPTDVNSTDFGLIIAGAIPNNTDIYIYYAEITVYYSDSVTAGSVKGQSLNDAILIFDMQSNSWKVNTYERGGNGVMFSKFIDEDGELGLYSGSQDNRAVYRIENHGIYTDDNTSGVALDTTSIIRTKPYTFVNVNRGQILMSNVEALHFQYIANNPVVVKYALDGSKNFIEMTDRLPASYQNNWYHRFMPFGKECKLIQLQLEFTGYFVLYGFGFEYSKQNINGLKAV